MIIGSEFSRKNQQYLQAIGDLSEGNTGYKIPVQALNDRLELGRTELKNILEYFQELGYIEIATIGGPLLYGHITITSDGLKKCEEIAT